MENTLIIEMFGKNKTLTRYDKKDLCTNKTTIHGKKCWSKNREKLYHKLRLKYFVIWIWNSDLYSTSKNSQRNGNVNFEKIASYKLEWEQRKNNSINSREKK